MSINEVYSLFLYICSKNKNQGYISPDDFNNNMNFAQISFQDWLLGEFQKYYANKAVATVELGQNSIIRQRLSPAIYGYNLNIDSNGFSPYPGDFYQVDSMWSIYGYQRIRYVQQNAIYLVANSVIDPIDENPCYMITDLGFQFFPSDIGQAKMSYVRQAPAMKWAYTLDGNGRPVYDPINSVDPIWSDLDLMDIISRALAYVGVNLQSAAVAQYATQIKNLGQ